MGPREGEPLHCELGTDAAAAADGERREEEEERVLRGSGLLSTRGGPRRRRGEGGGGGESIEGMPVEERGVVEEAVLALFSFSPHPSIHPSWFGTTSRKVGQKECDRRW